ncbi:hypothetical protein [Nocardioides limicola]|uniref:hypothetical protein n=1 Tax=Nocardioides limicola TaxID=2803368 RepID=UPI00193B68F0|nr:hypothetical protein [Nocardioides sp. DJM-14]
MPFLTEGASLPASDQTQLRGLYRILARETNVSDLLQYLSDEDPQPWNDLIGFVPTTISREFKLARVDQRRGIKGTADLVLQDPEDRELLIELKLGHSFSQDQRERYEASTDGRLLLAGLAADEALVQAEDRWEFLPLAAILDAWRTSDSPAAASLATTVSAVIKLWDADVSAVLVPSGSPRRRALDSIRHKFLARVVSRHIADEVAQRGWESGAGVTSGGGLAIVQAWAHIRGDEHRCFIAEVRWWEDMGGGELRLGVDYHLPETRESRAETWELATDMEADIRIDALRAALLAHHPALAQLVVSTGSGRPVTRGDWLTVVELGFRAKDNPDGVKGNRRNHNPGFVGDGTQRYEAVSPLDFTKASAPDLVELIDACLKYLCNRLPPG